MLLLFKLLLLYLEIRFDAFIALFMIVNNVK